MTKIKGVSLILKVVITSFPLMRFHYSLSMSSGEIETIKSTYYSALGLTGLSGYIDNVKPKIYTRIWVCFFIYFILPAVTCVHFYTSFFSETSYAQKFLAMSLGLDQFQIMIKSAYFHLFITKMHEVVLDFNTFNCVQMNTNAIGILKSSRIYMLKLQKFFNTTVFICFCSWSLVPIISSPTALFYSVNLKEMSKVLPVVYPFDVSYFPMAQIIYIYEVICTMGILMHFAGNNLFFVCCIFMIVSTFEVLKKSFEICNDPEYFKKLIIDHQRLLGICKNIRDLLSPILALQLLVSSLTICFAIYEITMVNETSKGGIDQAILYSRKSSYTVIIFIELLMYCWLSTELQDATVSVRDGLYNGPWYLNKKRKTKEIIIISARTLRPTNLTALLMVNLRLGTSIEVLRAAYSYYTMLKQMNH